jgi:tripartite-type tricarboxylate transporter receptor subunit TctC
MALALAGAAAPGLGRAQPRALRIIVPFAAGGASDSLARMMADAAAGQGVPMVVENRGGGASIPGTQAIVQAPADGGTAGVIDTALVINPGLFGDRMPFDAERDLAPVGMIATAPLAFVVGAGSPARSLAEWVEAARRRPGGATLGHPGIGTAPHLAGAQLLLALGAEAVVAAYRGGAPLVAALLAGEVEGAFLAIPTARPQIEAGRLRPLAVAGASRSPALPAVPSFAEAGLPAVDAAPFFGVVAPAGTPAEAVARLHALLVAPAGQPPMATRLQDQGYAPVASAPGAFAATLRAETAKWRQIIRAAGITPE